MRDNSAYAVDLSRGFAPLLHIPSPGGLSPQVIKGERAPIVRLAVQAAEHGEDERCELRENKAPLLGALFRGIDMRVPADFPQTSLRFVCWQTKTTAMGAISPFLALRMASGGFELTIEILRDGKQYRRAIACPCELPSPRDGWIRWAFSTVHFFNKDCVTIWANGDMVASAVGNFGIGGRQYFKFGPYRDCNPLWGAAPAALDFRNIRRGRQLADVL